MGKWERKKRNRTNQRKFDGKYKRYAIRGKHLQQQEEVNTCIMLERGNHHLQMRRCQVFFHKKTISP